MIGLFSLMELRDFTDYLPLILEIEITATLKVKIEKVTEHVKLIIRDRSLIPMRILNIKRDV